MGRSRSSGRNSDGRHSSDSLSDREPVEPKKLFGHLVTVHWQGKKDSRTFVTYTVITEDSKEAIETVKPRLCISGYETKFQFNTIRVAIIDGVGQEVPIANSEKPQEIQEPVHNN